MTEEAIDVLKGLEYDSKREDLQRKQVHETLQAVVESKNNDAIEEFNNKLNKLVEKCGIGDKVSILPWSTHKQLENLLIDIILQYDIEV